MSETTDAAPASTGAKVSPIVPLTLLETVRALDLPGEVLEGEDLPAALPRRLGLSDVVASQIRRYQLALRRGERIPRQEVVDLLHLVLRRPDAERIFRESGRRMARAAVERGLGRGHRLLSLLPRRLSLFAARRASARLLLRLGGVEGLRTSSPLVARAERALTAAADATGSACVLYSGALEEIVSLYTRSTQRVRHSLCTALGDGCCEWTLETG